MLSSGKEDKVVEEVPVPIQELPDHLQQPPVPGLIQQPPVSGLPALGSHVAARGG